MTLSADEFMRRFLLHVLPAGFHRIRHYGLLANSWARRVHPVPCKDPHNGMGCDRPRFVCMHCGAAMIVMQTFTRGPSIRAPPVGEHVP